MAPLMDAGLEVILERIVLTVFPLAALVAVGFLYARRHRPDMEAVNRINIDVFVPALMFSVLSDRSFALMDHASLVLACGVIVFGSAMLAYPFCWLVGLGPRALLPPMMFRNSGNLGLPVAVLAFGEQALPAAVVLFITTNVLHFSVGIAILNHRANLAGLLKMPMIVASLAGLCWSALGVSLPAGLATAVDMLGRIAIPLMLFALGARMVAVDFSAWRIGLIGALLGPASGLLLALLVSNLLPLGSLQLQGLLLYSALPPAVMNFILAERFARQPLQVAAIVLIGNLASMLVIPVVLFLLLRH